MFLTNPLQVRRQSAYVLSANGHGPFRSPECPWSGQGGDVRSSAIRHPREPVRRHARRLNSLACAFSNAARWELPAKTLMRAAARAQYPTRYLPAFGHRRSSDTTSRSCVEGLVTGAMHQPITLAWTCYLPSPATASRGTVGSICTTTTGDLHRLSCPAPMGHVSLPPGGAACGTRNSRSRCDNMTETGHRHDPNSAIQSLRGWQQRHGLAAGRLVARSGRGRSKARR